MPTLLLTTYLICTNCVNGFVYSPCHTCDSKGCVYVYRRGKVACRDCSDRLYNQRKFGSGKIKRKCKICKGKKRLIKFNTKSR